MKVIPCTCSYETTKAVVKKAQKKFRGFNRIQLTLDLRDTSAMLYQLSYEVLLVVGTYCGLIVEYCSLQLTCTAWLCNCFSCFITVRVTFSSILYPQCIHDYCVCVYHILLYLTHLTGSLTCTFSHSII